MKMKFDKKAFALIAILAFSTMVSAITSDDFKPGTFTTGTAQNICLIIENLRYLLMYIAGAIATLVLVINGIKWTGSSDDPGARKQAKQGIIHAVVGLIIVMIAVNVVALIYAGGCAT